MKRVRTLCGPLMGSLGWLALAGSLGLAAPPPCRAERPNILFIMADDHANHALGCYGSRINQTPNLDRLAAGGMRFDNCFCTNSICSPSRAVILTGKYSHLNGLCTLANEECSFDGSQETVAKLLQRAGYQTAIIGKWHLGSEPTGFDYWSILPGQGRYQNPVFLEMEGTERTYRGYVTDVITDKVLDFLTERRDPEKPFFVMYHHKAPHRPFDPAPQDKMLWEDVDIPEPPTLWDDYSNRASPAKGSIAGIDRLDDWSLQTSPPKDLAGEELKKWKYQRYIKQYTRTLVSVDRNLGRVLEYLDRSGLADNTVVIYTSDQGFFLGDHGWNDKRFFYDEAVRMPLLVRWPKHIRPGSVCDKIVLNLDFAETFLDLAGLPIPDDMQGHSLSPLFKGQTPPDWRTAMYYRYYEYESCNIPRHYGVRTDRFKLICYHDLDEWELFDLANDPHELVNAFDDPAYRSARDELTDKLWRLKKQYRDDDSNRGEPLEYGRITSNRHPTKPWIPPDLKVWAPLTLDFRGPVMNETDSNPNPFLDYRLQVLFTGPSGQEYNVPGYFDGDGQGGSKGDVWRVRFSPDEPGAWHYAASFRKGEGVAISLDSEAGRPTCFDGSVGTFQVALAGKASNDFRHWGRLEYTGKHYLKFRNGPYWIRGGTDSPEDFLAYAGFDNTLPSHHYTDHASDWQPGDPDWGDGKGRGIIGSLNYLASKHVNSLYFLVMNIGGDGSNVWPYAGSPNPAGDPANDNLHFDLAKLRQWEVVFAHAQRKGIFLHFVLNEAEKQNKKELDGGELGTERKLYYREVVARFAHHLAMQWNLCEEYNIMFDLRADRVRQFADYVRSVDPYGHPITVHSAKDPLESLRFTFGDDRFSMTSIQLGQRRIDTLTEQFRKETADSGRPLPVSMDEFTIDGGTNLSSNPVDDAEGWRLQKIWPTYLSGGNVEFILQDLLETESFKTRERDKLWDYLWFARQFVEALPFWEMEPADDLLDGERIIQVAWNIRGNPMTSYEMGGQVFAKPGQVYAIYLPNAGGSGKLDLSNETGTFRLRWYDPRHGRFAGEARQITGGSSVSLGKPPSDPESDWAVLIDRGNPNAGPAGASAPTADGDWIFKEASEGGWKFVSIEAEDASSLAVAAVAAVPGASGGEVLYCPDEVRAHKGKVQVASYRFTIKTPGRWYVWLRTYAAHDIQNGVYLTVDGKLLRDPDGGDGSVLLPKNGWGWSIRWQGERNTNHVFVDLDRPGEHVLTIVRREPMAYYDKILLTCQREWAPTGGDSGPPESVASSGAKWQGPPSYAFHGIDSFQCEGPGFHPEAGEPPDRAACLVMDDGVTQATAALPFSGKSGKYALRLEYIPDKENQVEFTVRVDGVAAGTFLAPADVDAAEPANFYIHDVAVNNGQKIEVAARSETNSRARWRRLFLYGGPFLPYAEE